MHHCCRNLECPRTRQCFEQGHAETRTPGAVQDIPTTKILMSLLQCSHRCHMLHPIRFLPMNWWCLLSQQWSKLGFGWEEAGTSILPPAGVQNFWSVSSMQCIAKATGYSKHVPEDSPQWACYCTTFRNNLGETKWNKHVKSQHNQCKGFIHNFWLNSRWCVYPWGGMICNQQSCSQNILEFVQCIYTNTHTCIYICYMCAQAWLSILIVCVHTSLVAPPSKRNPPEKRCTIGRAW